MCRAVGDHWWGASGWEEGYLLTDMEAIFVHWSVDGVYLSTDGGLGFRVDGGSKLSVALAARP